MPRGYRGRGRGLRRRRRRRTRRATPLKTLALFKRRQRREKKSSFQEEGKKPNLRAPPHLQDFRLLDSSSFLPPYGVG
jgi:hypothetical protein